MKLTPDRLIILSDYSHLHTRQPLIRKFWIFVYVLECVMRASMCANLCKYVNVLMCVNVSVCVCVCVRVCVSIIHYMSKVLVKINF